MWGNKGTSEFLASQGIQAQTLSNLFLAMEAGLEIVPVLNKIDLPGAEPERRRDELVDLLGVDPAEVLYVSAKAGTGVPELLERLLVHVHAAARILPEQHDLERMEVRR